MNVDLFEAFLFLSSKQEIINFFKDLCTPKEIAALSERWRVCQLLQGGELSYREIHAITGASLTTIGRVARFLKDETNHGYSNVFSKISAKQEN